MGVQNVNQVASAFSFKTDLIIGFPGNFTDELVQIFENNVIRRNYFCNVNMLSFS
jgi:tRNA A37 methylthiotransferase MiaB